ncbi:hypothetical protein Rsub_06206 [Raphidocelis subcapitata]|uniref:Amine oxidase domain-containing protein n=1 Tax=Raphidocelis subcapitata TaxID=307507 RepID=A0A2V0P9W3_9CHLO|nr:hypothetical protein Rsub_06206 [Raphidocelis subcapitata]|eukprot:GBF93957.1 hypothetical protein Rsub_06206 [Raphidocelis subcapitata]
MGRTGLPECGLVLVALLACCACCARGQPPAPPPEAAPLPGALPLPPAALTPNSTSGGPPAAAAAEQQAADVIVVGAGIAGLAAAKELAASGLRVVVLEARNRTGGRLHSVPTAAGGRVDLGAMWAHGWNESHPLRPLISALGLNVSRKQNYNSGAIFQPGGGRSSFLSYAQVQRGWTNVLEANITRMRAAASAAAAAASAAPAGAGAAPPRDVPVLEPYLAWLEGAWLSPNATRQANLLLHTRMQVLLNANASELSALRYGDAKTLPAEDVLIEGGMDALTDDLARGLDVRLGTVVTNISHDASGVRAAAAGGAAFAAPFAVVTLPLGVLKEPSTVVFDPPLPAAKRSAGMGVLDKVVMVWPEPWWPKNADFISREMPDLSGEWCVFLNYYATLRLPVLVALHAADTARGLEARGDAEVLEGAMEALRGIGGPGVPPPSQSFVTRWAADPFARGSYSFYAVGNPRDIVDALGDPVGRLHFAGEATSRHPATAHGAYESGLREARRVLAARASEAGGAAAAPPAGTAG